MRKRFSFVAFVLAVLIHFAGTWALFAEHFRALAEWKRSGAEDPHPVLLAVIWWIWEPVPLLIRKTFQAFASPSSIDHFTGPSFLIWSFCVGILFGFLVPRLVVWWHRHI